MGGSRVMAHAAYDAIADWYEDEFLAASAGADPLGIREALGSLLGSGRGTCLEVHAFHEAGLTPERYAEGGGPTPMTFSLRARRPA